MTCEGSNYFTEILRLIRMLILNNNNRLFSISILHPPVPYYLFPAVRKMQAPLQIEIPVERWFIQTLLSLSWTQWPILQRRHKSLLGRSHPHASRNIQIVERSALSEDVQRNFSFNSQNRNRGKKTYIILTSKGGWPCIDVRTDSLDSRNKSRINLFPFIWALENVF